MRSCSSPSVCCSSCSWKSLHLQKGYKTVKVWSLLKKALFRGNVPVNLHRIPNFREIGLRHAVHIKQFIHRRECGDPFPECHNFCCQRRLHIRQLHQILFPRPVEIQGQRHQRRGLCRSLRQRRFFRRLRRWGLLRQGLFRLCRKRRLVFHENPAVQSFQRCRTDALHLQQLFPVGKAADLCTVCHDALRQNCADPRQLFQFRRSGSVQFQRERHCSLRRAVRCHRRFSLPGHSRRLRTGLGFLCRERADVGNCFGDSCQTSRCVPGRCGKMPAALPRQYAQRTGKQNQGCDARPLG